MLLFIFLLVVNTTPSEKKSKFAECQTFFVLTFQYSSWFQPTSNKSATENHWRDVCWSHLMRENKGINRIDTRNIPHFEQKYHDFTGKCKSYSPLVFQQRFDQIHSQSIPSAIVCCIKQESSLFTFRNQTPGITRSGYFLMQDFSMFSSCKMGFIRSFHFLGRRKVESDQQLLM